LVSIPQYLSWSDTTTSFESMAASDTDAPEMNLTQDAERKPLKTARASADYFCVFGAQLALGRNFSAPEDSPAGPKAAVITDGLWRRRFRGTPTSPDARSCWTTVPYRVAGVLAPGVRLESPAGHLAGSAPKKWAP
jgi:putative ABC transport system permease protein